MARQKDDWEKPRSKGQHLTEAEIGQLKAAYKAGTKSVDAARDLKCSSRVVGKYFGFFESEGVSRRDPQSIPTPSQERKNRFYKSNFEL